MTSITESFRRRITNAELVLPLVDDTLPQVRIRLDFLKKMLDEIDAEHERRMEQAVESTLGRGTCHITDSGPWGHPYVCSACGASFDPDVRGGEFNFCPNCGARIEVWTHEHD